MAGIGAMLPDVWRMANRRARARHGIDARDRDSVALRQLAAGVAHHLDTDRWFHDQPTFRTAVAETAARIDAAGIRARKMRLLAHPLVEIALDGALIARQGLDPLLGELGRARRMIDPRDLRALLDRHASGHPDNESTTDRVLSLLDRIVAGPWIAGYRQPRGLADRLGGMRHRLGLPPVDDRDRHQLEAICRHAIESAPRHLETFERAFGDRPR